MKISARWGLLLAWLAALAILGVYTSRELRMSTDLRLFMPAPQTPAERLILEEVGESPASRLLLLAIEGDAPEALASTSQALVDALRDQPLLRLVANGDSSLDDVPEALLAYRYLLTDSFDAAPLDAARLRRELISRQRDLSSPAAGLLEEWLPRDPTLEVLHLAERWQPAQEAHRAFDVWFDPGETHALLVVETAVPGFDPDRQREVLDLLQATFAKTRVSDQQRLIVSGPGAFSVLMKEKTAGEATQLGVGATVGMILLLILAYRRCQPVVLGALPLVSAGLVGLAAVSAVFDAVHGITLAFGFTLIGVAQDYPMHLFSHQHAGLKPRDNARALWPTLATGVASTCIAYGAFAVSGVNGLAQLACFTIAGLATAGLTTRFLLPPLMSADALDHGQSRRLQAWWDVIARLPRPRGLAIVIALVALAIIVFRPGPLWENNLGALTPLPPELLQQDVRLRGELGAPDVRYLIAVEGADAQAVLRREAALVPALDELVTRQAIAGYDHAARYLPPIDVQTRRRAALPDEAALRAMLVEANAGLAFKPEVFEDFIAEVGAARALLPLEEGALANTPLALRVGGLLLGRPDHRIGLVTLTGVRDPAALASLARTAGEGVALLDLKQSSEDLVARYRERILVSLGIAALLLIGVVGFALRDFGRARRVLLPMALTTLIIVALLHGAGVALSLFHLIALVLAAGLGLDYALFFEHAADDPGEQRRTLHAVLVCSASTLMVFALLALSSLPVLRAIGLTVTLGVIANFVLALMLTRPDGEARA